MSVEDRVIESIMAFIGKMVTVRNGSVEVSGKLLAIGRRQPSVLILEDVEGCKILMRGWSIIIRGE